MGSDLTTFVGKLEGSLATGGVGIRDFDLGVVETLGGVKVEDNTNMTGYYLKNVDGIDGAAGGVEGPSGFAGIPIVFSFPEDTFAKYKLPMLMVRRDSIDPAVSRWHPGAEQYNAPAAGSTPITVNIGTTDFPIYKTGYSRTVTMDQAIPYDLTYTIRLISKFRGMTGKSNHVNALLTHILRIFQPYCLVWVRDSAGEVRSYEAFQDSIGTSDEGFEIADRVLGFDITVRVEAELDLNKEQVHNTVIQLPSFTFTTITV